MLYELDEKVLDKDSSDLLQVIGRSEYRSWIPHYFVVNLDRPGAPIDWVPESALKKRF
jgi:hypothetical protein